MEFVLDSRLVKDCIVLGKLDISHLLLMNNSLVPWFILVPETDKTELIDLPHPDQARLLKEINLISGFTRTQFHCTKLNIGAIGNIVNQLHVHIIGRDSSDFCWPGVVWGTKERKPYQENQVKEIAELLKAFLGEQFTLAN
ncbi:HIT domain-containing protein [Kaarinaea lacus]